MGYKKACEFRISSKLPVWPPALTTAFTQKQFPGNHEMGKTQLVRLSVWLVGSAVLLVCIAAFVLSGGTPPNDIRRTPATDPAQTGTAGISGTDRPDPLIKRRLRAAVDANEPPGAPGPSDENERWKWLESLQAWGMKNPLIASRWAIETLSPQECWFLLGETGGIAFRLGAEDMQKGLSLLENLKKWDGQKLNAGWEDGETMYTALMAKLAAGAVASDPAKAIELAREFGRLDELAGHWAKLDPQQATQWARSLKDAAELYAVVKPITSSLVNNGRRDDMIDWVNSLVEIPTAYDQAVTAMLGQLPQDELGPMLKALLPEPPSDVPMALSLIRGIRENSYATGVIRGELLQQLAGGLGEAWLKNASVRSALDSAIATAALTMPRRDAVNYLVTGGGGIIPQDKVGTWSPAWIAWAQESPSNAGEWLAEYATDGKRTDVFQALSKTATQETVASGGGHYYFAVVLDNQGDFRLTLNDKNNQRLVQQSTYANGQWNPPLPQDLQGKTGEYIMKPIRERQNLRSALERFQGP